MPIHGYPGGVITANPVAPTSTVATGVWTTEQQLQATAAGRWPMAQTQVSRSLRFNSADTAYLSRTNTNSPTSTTKFTYSVWVKRGALSIEQLLLMPDRISASSSVWDYFGFDTGDTLTYIYDGSLSFTTTAVFRDVSAWYHIVLQYDSTLLATKCWVNNALLNTGSLTLNRATTVNGTARPQNIGRYNNQSGSPEDYFNGYMTEINMIDGLALDPSYFGFNDSNTGVWTPKQYTGTYGTNGFYLNFSDNSNTTAATLGKDYSGNGNNWTPNNFSVTAGAGNDSLVDSPTSYGTDTGVGGEVRGNYCTLYPLWKGANITMSNGNLDATMSAASDASFMSTITMTSGKWYWEVLLNSVSTDYPYIGVATPYFNYQAVGGNCIRSSATGFFKASNANKWNLSSSAYGSSFANGDIMMIAYDADNAKIYFGKNGTWEASSDPATGANPAFTGVNAPVTPAGFVYNCSWTMNFGQRAFAYTAPSGFKALCTQNLPTPTIGATSTTQANDYMNVVLWTGNGSTQNITGVGFQPDFVWAKKRSGAESHGLYDAVRGASNRLVSNSTAAAVTDAGVSAFLSDGFSISGANSGVTNDNGSTYVGWNWKANGAGSSNTDGSITSTVSANTTSGFSIVTYTGTGANATVGHGLGVAPSFIVVKRTNAVTNWHCYHSSLAAGEIIQLNLTNAKASVPTAFNSGTPTSTTFPVGADSSTNQGTLVAYCFAPVAGYSAFGGYTGNGSTDGTFVYTGFRPRWILIKNASAAEPWNLVDTSRDPYNVMANYLQPNSSGAEGSITFLDGLSNGFKLRSSAAAFNGSGNTMIYACFAENPFKYSLAR